MGLKNLPPTGTNFSASIGPASFSKRFSSLTMRGKFRHLKDNQDAVKKVISQYQPFLKRDGLSRQQRLSAASKIGKLDKLTRQDKKALTEVLSYYSKGKPKPSQISAVPKTSSSFSLFSSPKKKEEEVKLTKSQIRRNVVATKLNRERELAQKGKKGLSLVGKDNIGISGLQRAQGSVGYATTTQKAGSGLAQETSTAKEGYGEKTKEVGEGFGEKVNKDPKQFFAKAA